jgi:hypothetical protein
MTTLSEPWAVTEAAAMFVVIIIREMKGIK